MAWATQLTKFICCNYARSSKNDNIQRGSDINADDMVNGDTLGVEESLLEIDLWRKPLPQSRTHSVSATQRTQIGAEWGSGLRLLV